MKKKHLYLFMLTLALPLASNAQKKLELGIMGGSGIGKLSGNDITRQTHLFDLCYTGGLYARYHLDEMFSLTLGATLDNNGSKTRTFQLTDINGEPTAQTSFSTIDLLYATVPVTMQAKFGNRIQPYLNAGISMGYLISSTSKLYIDNTLNATSRNTLGLKKTEVSALVGAGVMIPIKERFVLSAEWRNNVGMSNISATAIVNNQTLRTVSSNLLIGAGIKL
jgi:opacity protein-like surface antigen